MKIHREGYPFIALFAAVNLLAFLLAAWLGWLLLPVTIWCVAFFRDPERNTPQEPGLIICPADGKLLPIVDAVPPAELGMGELILADQLTLLPSTLPFSSGPEPCAACWVPLRALPLVAMSSWAFCAPRGELMTISHLPSTAMLRSFP